MKKIESVNEIRHIQLDILLSIHDFFIKNGINYSLAYGTLLGAIRHKGYIPWDDDIDICLLRKDYQKLEDIFPKILGNRYVFLSLKRDDKWNRPYGLIYDSQTIEIEEASNNYKGIGIGIDVFPIDAVCDDDEEYDRFQKKRIKLVKVLNVKYLGWRKERLFIKNVIMAVLKLFTFPFSARLLSQKLDVLSQSYNFKPSTSFFYHSSDSDPRLFKRLPKTIFDQFIDVDFEGYNFKAMKGYDIYLSNIYGDYMTPPPECKRESTHFFEAYWK